MIIMFIKNGNCFMIYRGVKMNEKEQKKKSRYEMLRAIGIAVGTILLIAGFVFILRGFGIL